jgi:hypothetical protein
MEVFPKVGPEGLRVMADYLTEAQLRELLTKWANLGWGIYDPNNLSHKEG